MISGYTQSRTSARSLAAAARADRLADHMADGGRFTDFARAEGIAEAAAHKIWRGIRAGLGWQAI